MLGIEELVVDPVDDPVQLVRVHAQQLVEALAHLGRLDLFRVALADGVDDVGEMDASRQEVDGVVEARECRRECRPHFSRPASCSAPKPNLPCSARL